MKNILNHIKENKFCKAYLLYGEEEYLVRNYKNKIKEAITGDDTMNYSYYEGKDMDVQDIIDTSRTMPFFAEIRLIVIENSGLFKSSYENLAIAVKEAPETTCFLFVENEVDKRNKLYKTVTEVGYVCEMKTQTDEMLMNWTARMFSEAKKKITRDNMIYFLSKSGNNMDTIKNETEKLIGYTGNREIIEIDDIDSVCTIQTVDRVFDMINAISEKNKDKVMKMYSDLVALKEPPMKILALLGKQFATLLAVRKMHKAGHGNSAIAEKLGLRPFFVGKYVAQSKAFTGKQIRSAVEECVKADYDIKSGQIEDTFAVEMIIMKYCE